MDIIQRNLEESDIDLLFLVLEANSNSTFKNILSLLNKEKNNELEAKIQAHKKKALKKLNELEFKLKNMLGQKIESSESKEKADIKHGNRGLFYGVFDILHSGHFNALRQAKKIVNTLVVGVNGDEDVCKVKGDTVMKIGEREELVKACKWIDELHSNTPYQPEVEKLTEWNCDFYIHGDDIVVDEKGHFLYEKVNNLKKLKIIKRTEGVSTTCIIGRLITAAFDDKIKINDLNSPHDIQLKKDLEEIVKFKNSLSPMMSSFLATSHRISEFSNNKLPKESDKIVYICGDFDILHLGYIEALKLAKEEGDFLYVGVYDDLTARSFRDKGNHYPILNMNERAFNLLGLKYVDEVVFGAPMIITEDMIKLLNISKVIKFYCDDINNNNKQITKYDEQIYEVPKKLGILVNKKINIPLSNERIIDEIFENKEIYVRKYLNKYKLEIQTLEKGGIKGVKEI